MFGFKLIMYVHKLIVNYINNRYNRQIYINYFKIFLIKNSNFIFINSTLINIQLVY